MTAGRSEAKRSPVCAPRWRPRGERADRVVSGAASACRTSRSRTGQRIAEPASSRVDAARDYAGAPCERSATSSPTSSPTRPLTGNPSASSPTPAKSRPSDAALARELNLSETVFVLPPEADGHLRMRIFTPNAEVPFAGYPTSAASARPAPARRHQLETGAGPVPVRVEPRGGAHRLGRMEQPSFEWRPYGEREGELLAARGVERSLSVEVYRTGRPRVRRARERGRCALAPDYGAPRHNLGA